MLSRLAGIRRIGLIAIACGTWSAAPVIAAPLTLGTNWIVNGDAEAGPGSADGSQVSVPAWVPNGSDPFFTAVQYQPTSGSFPATTDPGPSNRGNNLFAGGPANAESSGQQFLDISSFASQIDAGQLSFVLSGYLGGWEGQNDGAVLYAFFIDPNSTSSPGALITGPGALARNNQTGLWFESTTGVIPAGTRTIDFRLIMTRTDGSYNDGYADNLSFVVTAAAPTGLTAPAGVPEPGSGFMMLGGGLTILALLRRRSGRKAVGA